MLHDNTWRFLCHPPLPPAMNMAIDEAISISFSKNKTPQTVRLYDWASPALTIGAFQKIEPSWHPFLDGKTLTILRRITGGRALLHDREITYSVVASTQDPLFSGGIKKTFYAIAQGLLAGLSILDVKAQIYLPKRDSAFSKEPSPFCAKSLSFYEIAVAGKKLIGSAQRRWRDHFLQHGSIVLSPRPCEEIFYAEKSLTLSDLLLNLPLRNQMEEALKIGFETAWPIRLEKGTLTPEENKIANSLVTEKYNNPAWTKDRAKRERP